MRNIRILVAAGLLLTLGYSNPALAGPGHSHSHAAVTSMSIKDTFEASSGAIKALISQGYKIDGEVLDPNWNQVSDENKAIEDRSADYVIVRVNHPEKNQTLYLLFSQQGELYDANFSGVFDGLE